MTRLKHIASSYAWVDAIANKTIIELKKTADMLEEVHNNFFKRFNTSVTKFNVLVILYMDMKDGIGKGVMLSKIGEEMLVTNANITGLIDRLEKEGYVKRIRGEVDRRKVMAVMTEEGKIFTEELISHYKEWTDRILSILNADEKNRIIKALEDIQLSLLKTELGEI